MRNTSMIEGLIAGYRDCLGNREDRSPVSSAAYRLHRFLRKRGPCVLSDIETSLLEL